MIATAKLFQDGQSQVVYLPREFRFQGDEVYVKRIGNAIVLLPLEDPWQAWIDSLSLFSTDFMETRNQPEK